MGQLVHRPTAIILAGGQGSRMAGLASQPKCLLEIGAGQTLLTRLIEQLFRGGITEIVICCSPSNFSTIQSFIRNHGESREKMMAGVTCICCHSSVHGPLPALAEALSHTSKSSYFLCLADIYFPEQFFVLSTNDNGKHDRGACCLLTGSDESPGQTVGSGFVACDGAEVRAISYHPFANAPDGGTNIRRWSGAVLFTHQAAHQLREHAERLSGVPLENWIQHLLASGIPCTQRDIGTFVNVNFPEDYRSILDRNALQQTC